MKNLRHHPFRISASCVVLMMVIWFTAQPVAGSAIMTLSPENLYLNAGESAQVAVMVAETDPINGFDVSLQFDAAQLQIVDADVDAEGVQLLPGEFLDNEHGFIAMNKADNGTGSLRLAMVQLAPQPPAAGSGVLFYVTVQAIQAGESTLSIVEAQLSSPAGEAVAVTVGDGVTVAGEAPNHEVAAVEEIVVEEVAAVDVNATHIDLGRDKVENEVVAVEREVVEVVEENAGISQPPIQQNTTNTLPPIQQNSQPNPRPQPWTWLLLIGFVFIAGITTTAYQLGQNRHKK